jgi:putative sugar O-methyltransferase
LVFIEINNLENIIIMNNFHGWDYPPKDILDAYIEKCLLFSQNDDEFKNFRRDEDYLKVLEGKDCSVGRHYLNRINNDNYSTEFLNNLEKFRENDIFGNPYLCDYDEVKKINYNTIMYAYQTLDMSSFIGTFQPKRIIEIGGGYGGMCKVFSSIYNFDEYVLVDLSEVIALCKKYLANFPDLYKKVTFLTPEDIKINSTFGDFDLSIAVFSMSECNEEVQNMYADKIILNSKYSFIGYNKLHLPGVESIYKRLLDKLSKTFFISEDDVRRYIDAIYVYLNRKN